MHDSVQCDKISRDGDESKGTHTGDFPALMGPPFMFTKIGVTSSKALLIPHSDLLF